MQFALFQIMNNLFIGQCIVNCFLEHLFFIYGL